MKLSSCTETSIHRRPAPGDHATGENGNYGGPCPPVRDKPHRYIFTLFALAVPSAQAVAGIPFTGSAALYGFVLNRGLGEAPLGTASFTAAYGR